MIGDILQPTHLLFVLVVALLVLGPKRLPEVGKALGRGLRDFRNAVSGDEIRDALNTPLEIPSTQADAAATAHEPEPTAEATQDHPPEHAQEPARAEPAREPAAEHAEPAKQNVA